MYSGNEHQKIETFPLLVLQLHKNGRSLDPNVNQIVLIHDNYETSKESWTSFLDPVL